MTEETPESSGEKKEKTDELEPMPQLTDEERRRIHREEKARIAEEERVKRAREEQAAAAAREAAYWATVKLGKCPQCGSTRIKQFQTETGGDNSLQWASGCLGCCLFWPLLVLVPFVGKKPIVETHRQCHDCGYRWRV